MLDARASATAARIGPNAVIQTARALRAAGGDAFARVVFRRAAVEPWLEAEPVGMVDELAVARLHRAVAALGAPRAEAIALDAGRRTAEYVRRNRIPWAARLLLSSLPAGAASRLLLAAIARSAWTFAGSGAVRVTPGDPAVIEIAANPIATPGCPWHRAVFEGLFRALVTPAARVAETACTARGAPACRFEIALSGRAPG